LGRNGVGGAKNRRNKNVVKRTVRYLFFSDFCQNGRMKTEKLTVDGAESGSGGRKSGRRPRSDTGVRQRLDPDQRAKIDAWLFDEQLSYGDVAKRAEQELGQKFSVSGISRYSRQEKCVRVARKTAGGSGYKALLQTLNDAALRAAQDVKIGNDPRALAEVAKVLVAARQEANHALRAATTREKFEFDAATACVIHQARVQAITADESLDDGQRILKVRQELFGPNLPL
jgi:hypothetical protein